VLAPLTRALGAGLTIAEIAVQRLAGGDSTAAAQTRALRETEHRPWALPREPWLQGQTWCDLLFAHWPLPVEALRPLVPSELPLDTYDGHAWLGVTPFEVRGLRARGTPPLPGLSSFPEVNVRTYVTVDGRPGIHFLSLDADSRSAVAAARRVYGLPYHCAEIAVRRSGEVVSYRSQRTAGDAALAVDYWPEGPATAPERGSIEHFLTERYCLYTAPEGRVHRADIHHRPWPLQSAGARFAVNSMGAPFGLDLSEPPRLLHLGARQDVVIWAPAPARR
jgi:uncharacterized protein